MPTLPEESVSDGAEVELIETDSLPTLGAPPPTAPTPLVPSSSPATPIALIVAALAVIVAVFAVVARPGGDAAAPTTDPPQTTLPTTTVPPSTTEPEPPPPNPLAAFDGNVPEELPGVISGFDARGALVVVDRTRRAPRETELELIPTEDGPRVRVGMAGQPLFGLDTNVLVLGSQLVVNNGQLLRRTVDLDDTGPDGTGAVVMVETSDTVQFVTYAPIGSAGGTDGEDELTWEVPSAGVEVLGVWGSSVVVEQGGDVWLVDSDGTMRPVVEGGRVLGYDGRHLTRLVCAQLDQCELAVGPIDNPDRHRVALPLELDRIDTDRWADYVAIDPAGDRLAVTVRRGGLSLPLVIELTTGDSRMLADGINHKSPLAWSPEGDWLAYVYTDDVMVYSIEEGRSWRVVLDREMQTLLWR